MEIKTEIKQEIFIINLSGEIDIYNSKEVKDLVEKKLQEGVYNYIINLNDVSYIDSSGIGSLIASRTSIVNRKGLLHLVNIKGSVKRVFDLTKLNKYFTISSSEEEALTQIEEKK